MYDNETQLISDLNNGNPKAFELVFHKFYGAICYFVQEFVEDPDVSKDIVSEVFITLWHRKHEFDNVKALKSFLYVSAKNGGLNYLRRSKMVSQHKNALIRGMSQDELSEAMLKRIFDAEVLREMHIALESLPGQCKRVLKMTLDGLNTDDIAEAMNLSAQTVRNTRVRAIEALKKRLAHCTVAVPILAVLVEIAGL